jgi:hypothetical protein
MDMEKGSSNDRFKEYLVFQIHRNIVNLYKRQLSILEDLRVDHEAMLSKLKTKLPKDFIYDINYMDKERYSYLRKKILDSGNEAIRDFEKSVENLEINLKANKGKKD